MTTAEKDVSHAPLPGAPDENVNRARRMRTGRNWRPVAEWPLILLVCAWLVLVFDRYVPELHGLSKQWLASSFNLLQRWGVLESMFLLLILMAAAGLGDWLLDRLGIRARAGLERACLSIAAGLAALSCALGFLGLIGQIARVPAYILLALPIVLLRTRWRRLAEELRGECREEWRAGSPPVRLLRGAALLYCLVFLTIVWMSALMPEFEYDGIMVHLYTAKTIALNRSVTAIPDVPQSFFPKTTTLLFTLGLLLHGQVLVKLINLTLGLLVLASSYSFARRFSGSGGAWFCPVILIATPIVLWEMHTAHIDLGFMLFAGLAAFSTVAWLDNSESGWWRAAIMFTAISLGTRYQALFALGSLAALVCAVRFLQGMKLAKALGKSVQYFLLALIGMIPWSLVNLVHTGNPVFPLLNDLFASPYWNDGLREKVLWQMTERAVLVDAAHWWRIITTFWHVSADPKSYFHGNLGPFYLLLIPLLLLVWRPPRAVLMLLAYAASYWVFWVLTGQHLRYLLGAVPALAVVAAHGGSQWIASLWSRGRRWGAGITAGVLALLLVLNTPLFEAHGTGSRYGAGVMQSLSTGYLTGRESRDEYLTRFLNSYGALRYLNAQAGSKKAFFWWTISPAAYYLDGQSGFVFSHYADSIFGDSETDILRAIEENRITHLIVDSQDPHPSFAVDRTRPFLGAHLREVYRDGGAVVYETPQGRLPQN